MAEFFDDMAPGAQPVGRSSRAGAFVSFAGAALSLALVAGVGHWGYKLVVRDVSGVPVVRALEGPMRQASTDPGGEVAVHTGLAVNAIAANGTAAPPEERVVLAPPGVQLVAEDLEIATQEPESAKETPDEMPRAGTGERAPAAGLDGVIAAVADAAELPVAQPAVARNPDLPLSDEEILALADRIAAEVAPPPAIPDNPDALVEPARAVAPVSAAVPGVARSIRPALRPVAAFALRSAAPKVLPPAPVVDAATIPAGTDLVQLGAFESEEIAVAEWDALRTRFADFMGNKAQVIQQTQSGGRTFYRLRAMGFADVADARRFCSALIAENAACIPVVAR